VTDPAPILDLIEAFRRSKTMFAAVALGIFDGVRPKGDAIERLLDACVALGLLEQRDGEYVNSPVADEYLSSTSPRTLSGYIRYSNNALYPLWSYLEEAALQGTNRWKQAFGYEGPIFDHFFKTEESKRDFLMGMHGFGMLSSPAVVRAFDLSRFRRLVDLGGATGHLCLAARDCYPNLVAAVFDLPAVAPFAREFCGERVEFIEGDFFRDRLPPADLYAVGRILHDWNEEKIRSLLAKIYNALPAGGGILIAEKLLSGQNVAAHMQSLNMLVCTEGRERSLDEYTLLLRGAGFTQVTGKVTGAPLDAVLGIKT
jgi:acetylserotonin N-methyltransferase